MTFKLLLGSGSRYRASLLERLAIPFEQASPDIDESALEGEAPAAYVARLAKTKAKALQTSWPGYWIIGSDQCCVIDGVITGKPHTEENALEQLKKVQGKSVIFLTGLCLLSPEGHTFSLVEPFTVHFRKLDEAALRRYISIEQPLDCAGSFKCEGLGINLFSALEGRDSNSLIGLPLIGLCDLIREAGLDPLALASPNG